LTRPLRLAIAGLLLVPVLLACGKPSGSSTATVGDVYAAAPSQADVRQLFRDSNWYEGPPTFGVSPLDEGRNSFNVKFTLSVSYLHIGSGEDLAAFYSVFTTTSIASTVMSNLKTTYAGEATSPQVGDATLYHGAGSAGPAPFVSHTFVRSGQIVVEIVLSRKDSQASISDLARYARKFVGGLKNLGQAKPSQSPSPVDPKQLPPPGRDITPLGSTRLPIEAFVVMIGSALPDNINAILRTSNVTSFTYGDYALNADTHMEVQTAFMKLNSAVDALSWAHGFGSNGGSVPPDANGVYHEYIPTGGTPAGGEYHYVFAEGTYGIYMICKPAVSGEAASRECEGPMSRTVTGWTLALKGLG
jgi:hypothetical protein